MARGDTTVLNAFRVLQYNGMDWNAHAHRSGNTV